VLMHFLDKSTLSVSKFLGMLGVKYLILEKDITDAHKIGSGII